MHKATLYLTDNHKTQIISGEGTTPTTALTKLTNTLQTYDSVHWLIGQFV